MLPNLLPILAARKYTFVQHLPGKKLFAPLAQLAEQVTLNHWVAGSIPARCNSSFTNSRAYVSKGLQNVVTCVAVKHVLRDGKGFGKHD